MPSGNIVGIYNYCDSWCERCKFTDRCEVARRNAAFGPVTDWESLHKALHESLTETKELLLKRAEELGVDLNAPLSEEEAADLEAELEFGRMAKSHPLTVAGIDYMLAATDWLENESAEKIKKALELMLLTENNPESIIAQTEESIQIIRWYKTMIPPKLARALSSRDQEFDDVLGTAKIAMISVQRSMEAWAFILHLLPEEESDEVLSMLASLEVLLRNCEKQFPKAMAFIRPGLDE